MNAVGLWRRVLNGFAVAVVKLVDDSGGVQKAQIAPSALELRDGTPVVFHYGFTSNAQPGAIAATLFIAGDRSAGIVIGINDKRYRLTDLASGEVAIYDDLSRKIWLSRDQIVIDGAGSPIRIIGDLQVTGEIWAHYGTPSQVGSGTHKHDQGADTHGDAEERTTAPVAGT